MVEIEFNYNQAKTIIQCNLNDKMKTIFQKYSTKIDKNVGELYFLLNGRKLEEDSTLKDINSNNESKIHILALDLNNEDDQEDNECCIPSKYIICPKCKENIRMSISNYKIKLYDCKNKHIIDNISFSEYEETQMINQKKIICEICKDKSKNDVYKNQFYRCLSCKLNLCPLCKSSHEKTHDNIIDYEKKGFICDQHYENYTSYCKDCQKDICLLCENDHLDHNIISYGRIMPNIKVLNNELKEQKKKADLFIKDIEDIIKKLSNLINYIEIYYKIYEDIIHNFNIRDRNYLVLQNITDMKNFNNDFYKSTDKIFNEKNIVKKFSFLIEMHNKMVFKDNFSENKIDLINEKETKIKENADITKENIPNFSKLEKKEEINKIDYYKDINNNNFIGNKESITSNDSSNKIEKTNDNFNIVKPNTINSFNTDDENEVEKAIINGKLLRTISPKKLSKIIKNGYFSRFINNISLETIDERVINKGENITLEETKRILI